MEKIKNLILKLKNYFKWLLIGYASLEVLYFLSYFLYMIIYNIKFKNEYNVDYYAYRWSSFVSFTLQELLMIAILLALLYFLFKNKEKEAKFLFTGWFIYTLVLRIFNLFNGVNNILNGGEGIIFGLLTFLGGLVFLLALVGIIIEVFNGSKKISEFSPIFFLVAFAFAFILSVFNLIGSFGDNYVYPFYTLFSIWQYPIFILMMTSVAYIYITPSENSTEEINKTNEEETLNKE